MKFALLPHLLLATTVSFAAIGCDKNKDGDGEQTGAKAVAGQGDLEPFAGKLSYELLTKVNRALPAYGNDAKPAPFAPYLAGAKKALGEPTHVEGKTYAWGFVEGSKCVSFVVADNDGKVDAKGAMQVDSAMTDMHTNCLKALGKWKEPVDDPNAPKVPTDGSAVAPTVLRAGVAGAPKAWLGKDVTVAGVAMTVSTSTSNGKKFVTISVADSKDKFKESISCSLGDAAEAPKVKQYEPITVTGKVTDRFGGGLDGCAIAAAK